MSDHRSSLPASYAPDGRTPAQIEADLTATRERLAVTVDSLVDRVHPRNVAQRTLASVKARFVDDDGRPSPAKIAPLAGAVLGTVAVLVGLRIVVRRSQR